MRLKLWKARLPHGRALIIIKLGGQHHDGVISVCSVPKNGQISEVLQKTSVKDEFGLKLVIRLSWKKVSTLVWILDTFECV